MCKNMRLFARKCPTVHIHVWPVKNVSFNFFHSLHIWLEFNSTWQGGWCELHTFGVSYWGFFSIFQKPWGYLLLSETINSQACLAAEIEKKGSFYSLIVWLDNPIFYLSKSCLSSHPIDLRCFNWIKRIKSVNWKDWHCKIWIPGQSFAVKTGDITL